MRRGYALRARPVTLCDHERMTLFRDDGEMPGHAPRSDDTGSDWRGGWGLPTLAAVCLLGAVACGIGWAATSASYRACSPALVAALDQQCSSVLTWHPVLGWAALILVAAATASWLRPGLRG